MRTATENGLPHGWTLTDVGNAFDVILGQSPPSSTYNIKGLGLPFFQGKAEFGDFYPVVQKWCSKPGKIAERGDVLISVRAPVGPTNIANEKCAIGRGLAAIRPLRGTPSLFVLYLLRAFESVIAGKGTGTTFQAITGDKLRQISIPFPPLPEQHRIVAKIEELLTRLDAGVKALNAIKAQLKRYRQSVLKSAFEGKLTAEWRNAHKGKLEPASVLLQRIKEDRKKKLGSKYKEAPPVDTCELPGLPEGWAWTRLGSLLDDVSYGTAKKCDYEVKGRPVLRIPNVTNGYVDHTDMKFAHFTPHEIEHYALKENDLLIIRSNGSVSLVGKSALVTRKEEGFLFAGYLIRLRLVGSGIESKYLNVVFTTSFLRQQVEAKAKSTSGVNNINSNELRSLALPLCSQSEQNEIVLEIDRCFSVADAIEKVVEQSLAQSERLRQSILKRAFEGKLVPQDARDEPAERLLGRIRAQREAMILQAKARADGSARKSVGRKMQRRKASTKKR